MKKCPPSQFVSFAPSIPEQRSGPGALGLGAPYDFNKSDGERSTPSALPLQEILRILFRFFFFGVDAAFVNADRGQSTE
jgi:hypothetical protein